MGSVNPEKGLWLRGDPITPLDAVSISSLPGSLHSEMRSAEEVSLASPGLKRCYRSP